MHLNGENKLNVIKWVETRDEHAKVLKIYVHENIYSPGVCLLLPGGYIHAYDQNIQTSLQPHGRSKPNFMERERKFV